jgi:hypoxanthine phosphoribosyltransferase
MVDVVNILLSGIFLVIGYFLSRYQSRQLIKKARQFLLQYEAISLRDEFHMTHILASKIRSESFHPDLIIAITPGGSMIGEWLSRSILGDRTKPIRMCSLWMQAERDAEGQHRVHPKACSFQAPSSEEVKKILIVLDISRSGRTLDVAAKFVEKKFQDSIIKTAVLFLSQEAQAPYPDFWVDKPYRHIAFEWKERGI